MTRFLTRLFGSRTPAATRPARRVSLNVETLESRETPSGLGISRILHSIAHTIQQVESIPMHTSNIHQGPQSAVILLTR
jgi:hypothetical protein